MTPMLTPSISHLRRYPEARIKAPNLPKVPNLVIIRLLTIGSQPGHHGHPAIVPDRLRLRHATAATGVQRPGEIVGFGARAGRRRAKPLAASQIRVSTSALGR